MDKYLQRSRNGSATKIVAFSCVVSRRSIHGSGNFCLSRGLGDVYKRQVSQPHAVNRFGVYEIEEDTSLIGLKKMLQRLGYETRERSLNSGLNVILKKDGKLYGGSDPRREGIAIGG